jgi:hypothetical protein
LSPPPPPGVLCGPWLFVPWLWLFVLAVAICALAVAICSCRGYLCLAVAKLRQGMADIQAKMCGFPFPWPCSYSHGPQGTPDPLPQ